MTERQFKARAAEIAKENGLDLATAEHYFSLIGDTPELCDVESGQVIVRDESGREIARIRLPGFDSGKNSHRTGTEMFYLDEHGVKQDAALWAEMLDNPAADRLCRQQAVADAMRRGHTRESAIALYGDPEQP